MVNPGPDLVVGWTPGGGHPGLCPVPPPHLKPEDNPAFVAGRYFTNHRHQLDYPTYRAQGYQIGPGTMESGCKQIGLERLKIAGARWSRDGA